MKTMKKQTTAAFLTIVLGLFGPGLTGLRAQGQQEGIKVHGHWTIDVRQPDGTLVTHREFENALAPAGVSLLAQLLGKVAVPGSWVLQIGGGNSQSGPCNPAGWYGKCTISDPLISVPTSGVNANRLVLTGTVTAENTNYVGTVWSGIGSCPSSVLAGNCTGTMVMSGESFSTASFPAISVVAGQIIQLTVVFSFS